MEPKLRFKEFSGDWEEKRLGDIAKIKGGYAFDSKKFIKEKSEFQVIKMGNVYQNELILERNPSYIQEVTNNELEYMLKKNDIIITLTGTIGKKDYGYSYRIKDNSKKLLLNQRLALIKNNKNCNPVFLEYIIKNNRFLYQFFSSSTGGTGNQSNVSIKSVEKFKVNIPSLPEQTKIADFLSTVDEKIQNQQDKITHLENIKKGFMQKIFSRKIRFKDVNGNEFPEWEEKKLGEISKVTTGNSNVDDNIVNGKYRFFDRGLDSINYLNEYFLDAEAIIYPGEGSKFMPRYYNGKFALHQRCYAIYDMSHSINVKYVFYYMQTLNKYFLRTSVGTTVPSLRQSNFEKCKIEVPCLEEQQKIADLLSSFDEKIDAEKETLEHLKELKKGLLQQMFV